MLQQDRVKGEEDCNDGGVGHESGEMSTSCLLGINGHHVDRRQLILGSKTALILFLAGTVCCLGALSWFQLSNLSEFNDAGSQWFNSPSHASGSKVES